MPVQCFGICSSPPQAGRGWRRILPARDHSCNVRGVIWLLFATYLVAVLGRESDCAGGLSRCFGRQDRVGRRPLRSAQGRKNEAEINGLSPRTCAMGGLGRRCWPGLMHSPAGRRDGRHRSSPEPRDRTPAAITALQDDALLNHRRHRAPMARLQLRVTQTTDNVPCKTASAWCWTPVGQYLEWHHRITRTHCHPARRRRGERGVSPRVLNGSDRHEPPALAKGWLAAHTQKPWADCPFGWQAGFRSWAGHGVEPI